MGADYTLAHGAAVKLLEVQFNGGGLNVPGRPTTNVLSLKPKNPDRSTWVDGWDLEATRDGVLASKLVPDPKDGSKLELVSYLVPWALVKTPPPVAADEKPAETVKGAAKK